MPGISLEATSASAGGADIGFRLATMINGQPMAMRESELSLVTDAIASNRFMLPRNRATGSRITDKGTAIVEIHGMLIDRAPIIGTTGWMTAYEGIAEQCRRLRTNADVKAVVLDIDSPGGMVLGIKAAGEAIEQLGKVKPVYAIAHNLAASAGYWLASAAQRISVTPDGEVGSIGVRAAFMNFAEALDRDGIVVTVLQAGITKTDMSSAIMTAPGAVAERQYSIDRAYDQFCAHVARRRSMTIDAVRATDARCFTGEAARSAGLVDRVETLEDMVERIERGTPRVKRKVKSVSSSKAGLAPLERAPAEPDDDDDDDAPSARRPQTRTKTTGATHMTTSAERVEAQMNEVLSMLANPAASVPAPAPVVAPAPAASADVPQDRITAAVAAAVGQIFAVLESDAAKARPKLALALAKSGLPAVAAEAILAAAPEETAAAPAAVTTPAAELGSALERRMAEAGNAGGVKPEAVGAATRPSLADKMKDRAKKA
jgi:signal peptide peptidase SppA